MCYRYRYCIMVNEEGNPQTVGLAETLQQFKENKITKENVWSTHLIDDFQRAVENHHKSLGNFPLVGSVLEASSQIYGFKVDCVHNDAMRLSSGLYRQSIIPNHDESSTIESDHNRSEVPRRISKNTRRCKATVTKNKDLINAKLDVIAEPDSFFKKSSPTTINQLFQNVLPSNRYALQFKHQLWSSSSASVNNLDGSDDVILNADSVEFPLKNLVPSSNGVLRPKLTGYKVSDAPAEHVWISAVTEIINNSTVSSTAENPEHSIYVRNDSNIDFHFDIDAPLEPIDTEPSLPNIVDSDIRVFTEDDQNALRRCSGLRRKKRILSDLRPVTPAPLEYSYRWPLVQQDQFWAGPSYWKVPTTKNSNTSRRQREPRRKTKDEPVTFSSDSEEIDHLFILTSDPAVNKIRKCHATDWDRRKCKLPTDFKLNKNRFCYWSFAPSLPIGHSEENRNSDSDVERREVASFDTGEDAPDVDMGENVPDIDMGENVPDIDMGENVPDADTGEALPNTGTGEASKGAGTGKADADVGDIDVVDGIETDYFDNLPINNPMENSPVELQRQFIPMVGTPNLNIKAINNHCLEIISRHNGDVTFAYVYHQLSTIYGIKTLSTGIVFSSILELANQHKFHLEKIGENDFTIKKEIR